MALSFSAADLACAQPNQRTHVCPIGEMMPIPSHVNTGRDRTPGSPAIHDASFDRRHCRDLWRCRVGPILVARPWAIVIDGPLRSMP